MTIKNRLAGVVASASARFDQHARRASYNLDRLRERVAYDLYRGRGAAVARGTLNATVAGSIPAAPSIFPVDKPRPGSYLPGITKE